MLGFGCENIHFAGDFSKSPQNIWLTEGILKADVASFISGKPFLGLVGVGNTGGLAIVLRDLYESGLKNIYITVDMDLFTKKEVRAALAKIRREINRVTDGISVKPNGLNTRINVKISENGNLKAISPEKYPDDTKVYMGKTDITKKHCFMAENEICIPKDDLEKIKNCDHVLKIESAVKGFSESFTVSKSGLPIKF